MRATKEEKVIAQILRAFGTSYADIGKLLLRAPRTISYWCDKAKAQACRERAQALVQSKRTAGLTVISPETHRRGYLRLQARAQAKESGEPVEEIYKRWGVVSKHSRRAY